MGGTVNAKTVRATLQAARVLGLDAAALAAAHGMGDALTDVDARVIEHLVGTSDDFAGALRRLIDRSIAVASSTLPARPAPATGTR